MNQLLVKTFILLASVALFRTEVTVENAEFINVLVSFSQSISPDEGKTLLENLRTHIGEASEILQNSIGLRFFEVTFQIPKSWDTSEWNITLEPSTGSLSSSKADILVDNTNDNVFGAFPFAMQYGSCGVPGDKLVIPSHFLTEEKSFPKATLLAREWLKFRYGVFDENGYPEDELYPLYYAIPGTDPSEVIITDCTNKPVTYTFIDKDGNNCSTINNETGLPEDCNLMPDEESLENVTSSLMYFQENIPHMQDVCGKKEEHSHLSGSPNKHNALCREQSVWDIITTSSDFSIQIDSEGSGEIEFKYVQEPSPKVVLAWENTFNLYPQAKAVLSAVKRFIYQLPNETNYAAFPFTEKTDIAIKALKNLNNWPDDRKTEVSNVASSFSGRKDGCVHCAIETALNILSSDNAATGTAVIIASGKLYLEERILQKLKDSKICLLLLVFIDDATPLEYFDYASASSCGYLTEFLKEDSNQVQVFEKLYQAMESVLPDKVDDKVTATVKTEQLNKDTSLSFDVDGTVEKITFWTMDHIETENMEFKFNEETITLMEEIQSSDICSFSYSPTQEGKIELKLRYDTLQALTQATVTSKAGQYLHGQVFIHDTTPKDSPTQMPVIIYASIRFGEYPVQDATVVINISKPNGDELDYIMFDNGRGDPDITANDGVYSRYFTKFNDKGEYTVTVTVKKDENTRGGKLDNANEYQSCCGSMLKKGNLELPDFEKTFQTTFEALGGRPDDGYKPSRIVDLKIDSVSNDKVILKWTAPGAEADDGTATKYETKLFCEQEGNTTGCELHQWVRVLNMPKPMNYGTKQQVSIQVLNNSQTLSVGIVSINENNHESDMSNIIKLIRLNSGLETTTSNPDSSNDEVQASPTGIIVGSTIAGIVVLICIIGAIIYFHKRKSKKQVQENDFEYYANTHNDQVNNPDKASNPSINEQSMRRVESFPVLLYTHNQIKDFKDKEKDPPLYKGDVPPKPWMSLNVLSPSNAGEKFDSDTKNLESSSTMRAHGTSAPKETNQMVEVPLR